MDFIFYVSLFLFIALFGALDINIDYDFWARLIVGKSFFQTGTLFNNDFYSFGKTHEFIDHEWGSSLIFYLIQNYFGDVGLFVFKTTILFLTFFFIVKTIKLKFSPSKLHFLLFFFAIHSICYNIFSTIRCQIFSFFFFVFYIYILEYTRKTKNYRILWVLPVLNIIWANLHGGFVLGIVLILLFALGEKLNNKPIKPYLLTFFVSNLTSFINPYGMKYLIYIFDAFFLNRIHIPEWQSAFFNKNYTLALPKFKIFFFGFFVCYFCYLINNLKIGIKNFYIKIDKTKYILLIFSTLIALKSIRCHPFFVYCVLIYCYCDFNNFFKTKLLNNINRIIDVTLFVLIFISSISHLYNYKFLNEVNENFYPVNSVEFIKDNHLKGNIFTNFHTASYVVYKLYPDNYVYMDGRYEEVYDNSLINNMGKFFLGEDYQEFLNHYHFDILIMDKTYPKIINQLKQDKNWFLAFDEKAFCVFLPIEYKNLKLIHLTKTPAQINKEKFITKINWL